MLLENSVEHFHDIDEESLQDDNSSVEDLRFDDPRFNSKPNKKQKQTRNHILIFKNPMGLLD